MTYRILWIALVSLTFFPIAWGSPLSSQESAGEKKGKPNEIEGVWTQAFLENRGKVDSCLPGILGQPNPRAPVPHLWKISKEKMEVGPDNDKFPALRVAYELNPNNKAGTMDLVAIDKDGKKNPKEKWQAIYVLKDDWLFICWSQNERPESFTTTGKSISRVLYVLRRGKLK